MSAEQWNTILTALVTTILTSPVILLIINKWFGRRAENVDLVSKLLDDFNEERERNKKWREEEDAAKEALHDEIDTLRNAISGPIEATIRVIPHPDHPRAEVIAVRLVPVAAMIAPDSGKGRDGPTSKRK
jgi:hypothetical protein